MIFCCRQWLELPAGDAVSAALFCRHPKKRRGKQLFMENRATLGVCDQKMVEHPSTEKTLTIVLPNIIHGCKKLNLKRQK